MPEPKINVVINADGKVKEGVLCPQIGTKLEMRFRDAAKAKFAVDYRDPNSLTVTLAGDMSLRGIGMSNVRVGGELENSMFTGKNTFHGSVTWKIPKSIAVELKTTITKKEQEVGAKVTLSF